MDFKIWFYEFVNKVYPKDVLYIMYLVNFEQLTNKDFP